MDYRVAKIARNLDVDESGDNMVDAPAILYGYIIFNTATSFRYVKLYDDASAPTVGTDTPIATFAIPPQGGANLDFRDGMMIFQNGIGIGATTGVADNDTGAPGANDVIVNILYKLELGPS